MCCLIVVVVLLVGEASFSAGEIVIIVQQEDDGWWLGVNNKGATGWFEYHFVELIAKWPPSPKVERRRVKRQRSVIVKRKQPRARTAPQPNAVNTECKRQCYIVFR